MKKLISPKMLFLYISIFISVFLIFKFNNHNNITYLSLGDSYALGKDCYGIKDYGYSDYLKDQLHDTRKLKEYINVYSEDDLLIENLKNNITQNKISELEKQKIFFKESLQNADLMTLSIGIGDLRYKFLLDEEMDYKRIDKELKQIENNFDDLIKEIRKYYKKNIYVIGYPNNSLDSYYLSMAIRKYNAFLKDHKEIIYISTDELEYDKEKYFLNDKSNYYNKEGYKVISDKIFKTYQKSLKNN